MALNIRCACGKTLQVPESAAGKRAKCPHCGRVFQVPRPSVAFEPAHLSEPTASRGETRKTSGMAIASLVCSLLGLVTCGISAVVGVILGIVALRKIHRNRATLQGVGLATAGIVVGCVLFLIGLVLGIMSGLAIFRNQIKAWTTEQWERAVEEEALEEPDDFFGDNLNRSPVRGDESSRLFGSRSRARIPVPRNSRGLVVVTLAGEPPPGHGTSGTRAKVAPGALLISARRVRRPAAREFAALPSLPSGRPVRLRSGHALSGRASRNEGPRRGKTRRGTLNSVSCA